MVSASVMQLLDCLSDGQVHSGETLGRQLGITRAAVWKQIKSARELGVPLLSCRGNGYQLASGFELLNANSIRRSLSSKVQAALPSLQVMPTVDSTNSAVLRVLREQTLPSPCVMLAEQQTAGRGRRGRQWVSPFAQNIYFTLGWEFTGGVQVIEGLSLVVGLQVLQTLQALGATGLQLKWPNDVLWRQRKLAGILIEMQGDPEGVCQVAIGIGINISLDPATAAEINQPWVDLRQILPATVTINRNNIVANLLNRLVPVLQHLPAQGFAAYQQDWQAFDACLGSPVRIETGQRYFNGRGTGINEKGAYGVILGEHGTPTFFSGGEISLRVSTPEHAR